MAGHSKWANIKHKKSREDARRGKIFSKLSRAITVAARLGGGDPDTNSDLRLAIQKARDNNMPADNIERAIKKGTGELEGASYESFMYEGYGPGGVALYIELMSDNRNRTASEIRHILSKHGGNLGQQGCVAWMFSRRGQIIIDPQKAGREAEDLMLLAIDCGAEDFSEEDGIYTIYTAPAELENVRKNLENEGIKMESVDLAMISQNTVALGEKEARKVLRLMEALEDHDDVQEVYSNFDIPEEVMEAVNE